MSDPPPTFVPTTTEKTFSSYTKDDGKKYAQYRFGYHPDLYKTILDYHTSSGGQLDTLVDVGCGPGIAARALAPHFKHTIGLDPSEGMISNARALATEEKAAAAAATAASGESASSASLGDLRFEISTAEELGWHLSPPIEDSSVDLITASTAAHWFDMARFWPRAARVLKPGGTVALWSVGPFSVHPSIPNAEAIQASMDAIEERELRPFFEPGNWMTRGLYAELPLPWTITPQAAEFDEEAFVRKVYGPGSSENLMHGGVVTVDLDMMEKMVSTGSPVQRWREAHPETLETERDVVKMFRIEIERLLHEAGVEKGKEVITGSPSGVLLMVRRKVE